MAGFTIASTRSAVMSRRQARTSVWANVAGGCPQPGLAEGEMAEVAEAPDRWLDPSMAEIVLLP
jgi:hypothetical protein